ncbi:MAG: hypothetical protein H0T76_10125 [Nannocystis sp.]|nr:hypothetical protein [Nannocystis sp.]MBA3546828.1 hypothetical protein [Nannocystis sp.]
MDVVDVSDVADVADEVGLASVELPSDDEPSVALALSDFSGLHAPMSARTGIK